MELDGFYFSNILVYASQGIFLFFGFIDFLIVQNGINTDVDTITLYLLQLYSFEIESYIYSNSNT